LSVQEAPADKMAAITSLHFLLLGEALPLDPTTPVDRTTVAQPDKPTNDKPPIVMWDPLAVIPPPAVRPASPSPAPPAVRLAVIPLDDTVMGPRLPLNAPLPPVAVRQRGHWQQHVRPQHARPVTRGQLRERTAHMINCVIADAISTTHSLLPPLSPLSFGYAFAIHHLATTEWHSAALATQHFLGAIIDEDTSKMLEYRHLVKNASTREVWERSFSNKIGRLFQGIRNLKG
jgi:hypothetical protein